jgi:hypothetical protein
MEVDCDCGEHHVIDPAEVERFLSRRKFRCSGCNRRKHMEELGSLVASSPLTGMCRICREVTE